MLPRSLVLIEPLSPLCHPQLRSVEKHITGPRPLLRIILPSDRIDDHATTSSNAPTPSPWAKKREKRPTPNAHPSNKVPKQTRIATPPLVLRRGVVHDKNRKANTVKWKPIPPPPNSNKNNETNRPHDDSTRQELQRQIESAPREPWQLRRENMDDFLVLRHPALFPFLFVELAFCLHVCPMESL